MAEIARFEAASSKAESARNFRGLVPRDFFDFVNLATQSGYVVAATRLQMSPLRARFVMRTVKTHISPVLFRDIVEMTEDGVGWLAELDDEVEDVYENGLNDRDRSYIRCLCADTNERLPREANAEDPTPAARNLAPGTAYRTYVTVSAFAALCELLGAHNVRDRIVRAGPADYFVGWNKNVRIYVTHKGISVAVLGSYVSTIQFPKTTEAWADAAADILVDIVSSMCTDVDEAGVAAALKAVGIVTGKSAEHADVARRCLRLVRACIEFGPLRSP